MLGVGELFDETCVTGGVEVLKLSLAVAGNPPQTILGESLRNLPKLPSFLNPAGPKSIPLPRRFRTRRATHAPLIPSPRS